MEKITHDERDGNHLAVEWDTSEQPRARTAIEAGPASEAQYLQLQILFNFRIEMRNAGCTVPRRDVSE